MEKRAVSKSGALLPKVTLRASVQLASPACLNRRPKSPRHMAKATSDTTSRRCTPETKRLPAIGVAPECDQRPGFASLHEFLGVRGCFFNFALCAYAFRAFRPGGPVMSPYQILSLAETSREQTRPCCIALFLSCSSSKRRRSHKMRHIAKT
ncbi:hypothetical protein BDY21DRAFT_219313 [Lineolata rhizophorae]|uniref:Uncharacterized protein n=1 Tax=Lineolata rhizophorae TaxID=578093 RepID=A0A6A6P4P5_9PEZI|nr:hypothetical protein BDY21DRAFT_219313 [Lineolata rhizophorae]